MAKSDSRFYLDKNKTDLVTANNLYKYGLEGFNNTNILQEQQGLTKLAIECYTLVKWRLTEALLFGKAEGCAGLAYLNKKGLGGTESAYNEKLFLTIGSKLGDETCIKALTTLQDTSNVEKEANIWVNFINENKKQPDAEISSADIAYAESTLKTILSNNYVNLDAYNSNVDIIKVDQAETTSTYNIPRHQTTTPAYHPSTEENDHHKQPVKPLGQNADKHHHCDIL